MEYLENEIEDDETDDIKKYSNVDEFYDPLLDDKDAEWVIFFTALLKLIINILI